MVATWPKLRMGAGGKAVSTGPDITIKPRDGVLGCNPRHGVPILECSLEVPVDNQG